MKARGRKWVVAMAVAVVGSTIATGSIDAAGRPAAKSKYGGHITVGIQDTFPGFCVASIPNHTALGGFRSMYEQLFERSTSGEYVGALAESGTSNADFTQWTIKLRQNIKFHDNSDFNADVVKLNIDLNAGLYNVENPSASADFRTPAKGYASTGYGVNANIMKVNKIDDYTIRIDLDHSQSDFLGVLYRAGRYVMRAKAQLMTAAGAPEPTCNTKPIGTGPFKFVSYTSDTLEVERNDKYWRTNPNNGDKLPYLDAVSFVNIKEPSSRAAAVRKNTVQIASFDSTAGTFIKDLFQRKSVVTGYTAQYLWHGSWVPNVGRANSIFKYKNCRLAVGYAIDWNAYNRVRLKGIGQVSGSIVAKEHPMFTKSGAATYNAAKARQYVAACKTDLGGVDPGWSLYADTSAASQANVKFIQKYLEDAGFKMSAVDIKEASAHIGDVYANSYGVTQKMLTQGTPAEGGDSAYVSIFFSTTAYPAGTKNPVANTSWGKYYSKVVALSNFDDTKVDQLIAAAQAAPKASSAAKWKEVTAYLQSEGYQLPTVHSTFFTFVNKKAKINGVGKLPIVKGKTPQIVTNKGIDLTGIWIG